MTIVVIDDGCVIIEPFLSKPEPVVKNCNKVVFKNYFLHEFVKFSAALSTNKLHEDAASVQRKPE